MTSAHNKQLLQAIFAETAKGNGRPLVAAMSEDVTWTIIGSTKWSKTYHGRKAVLSELLGPLNAQLVNGNTITAHRFMAEDDQVVVEARGHNTTKTGKAYRNTYCWIFRLNQGKVIDLVEYTDTALIESVLQPPQAS